MGGQLTFRKNKAATAHKGAIWPVILLFFAALALPVPSLSLEIKNTYTILDPPSTETDQIPHAALIWYPGGLVKGSDYTAFAKDVQEKLKGKVRFWVCLVDFDWETLIPSDPSKAQLLQEFYPGFELTVAGMVPQLEARGFKSLKDSSGNGTRYLNVFTGGHSFGGKFATTEALKSAGPMILSGTPIQSPEYLSGLQNGLDRVLLEHPYPVLITVGELDGQLRWMSLAQAFVEAIQVGLVFGKKVAAARKNIALIPGMNHMQISEGETRYERGGIDADIPTSEAISKCGDLAAAFVNVHVGAGDKQESLSELEKGLFGTTMEIVKPYLGAAGLADVTSALEQIEQGTPENDSVPWKRSNFIDYSEEDAAEKACARMQSLILPESMKARVIPMVVEKLENFLAVTPLLQESGDSEPPLVVPVCYIFRHPRGSYMKGVPRTPEYWIKLALAEDATYSFDGATDDGAISLQDFCSKQNSEVFSEAKKVATKSSLDRYNTRGIPVKFGPDVVSDVSETSLEEWTGDDYGIEVVHDDSSTTNVVRCPLLVGENFVMVKTWGPARALGYLTINSLQTPTKERDD
ncbi:hypothetical protein BSKO_12267 [Bryopsis sp. KO-2023]|nr:hypothetical protein BSKO_12267 [Bryopsis sp. KO-2023]